MLVTRAKAAARRLLTVAVSYSLCRFLIGFLGILTSRDMLISEKINVGMAIFVLPLNLFLYLFSTI